MLVLWAASSRLLSCLAFSFDNIIWKVEFSLHAKVSVNATAECWVLLRVMVLLSPTALVMGLSDSWGHACFIPF